MDANRQLREHIESMSPDEFARRILDAKLEPWQANLIRKLTETPLPGTLYPTPNGFGQRQVLHFTMKDCSRCGHPFAERTDDRSELWSDGVVVGWVTTRQWCEGCASDPERTEGCKGYHA